jgi:hypothetical protein
MRPPLKPRCVSRGFYFAVERNSSGILAMLMAMRRASSRERLLKQRFGPVAAAMKFIHWVCEEMDQCFAGYSV